MSRGTGRRALVATAIIGFVVGIAVSVRYDLVSRSEALNLFGGGDQQQAGQGACLRSCFRTSPIWPSTCPRRW